MMRLTAAVVIVLAAAMASAQTPPVRVDPLTATISGRVTTIDTGAPLRRAEIRVTSDGGLTRLATTDADGQYQVRDLPAGTFTVHVSRTGFVPLYFGQRRPFESRTTVRLAQGQRATANIALPRAGAITGRIVDTAGEPVLGGRVQALRRRMMQGQRGLQAVGVTDVTDDTGAFRIYGLPPGDYYVAVTPRQTEVTGRRVAMSAINRGTIPVFYPGTANRQEAQRVAVDVGGEARADMQLGPVRTWRVSGHVLTSSGGAAAGAMLTLLPRDASFGAAPTGNTLITMRINGDARADGSFELTDVPPGAYIVSVTSRPSISAIFDAANQRFTGPSAPEIEAASMPIDVDGDVDGLTLTTSRGGTLDVQFVRDQGVTRAIPPGIRFAVRMTDGSRDTMTRADDKFQLSLTQPARLDVENLPDDWAVKAILLENEDVIDKPIQLLNGQAATARIVLTDRVTEVAGTVTSTAAGANAGRVQATVIAFADDDRKWTYPSRFIRTLRTDDKGTFRMSGLPPDETYRVIAVDYLEEGEETDSDFLERMRDRATRVPLQEAERRTIDLKLIQR